MIIDRKVFISDICSYGLHPGIGPLQVNKEAEESGGRPYLD